MTIISFLVNLFLKNDESSAPRNNCKIVGFALRQDFDDWNVMLLINGAHVLQLNL